MIQQPQERKSFFPATPIRKGVKKKKKIMAKKGEREREKTPEMMNTNAGVMLRLKCGGPRHNAS